ncbi:sigma-70 family RNA polymerase sigma factor [Latilactobacillus curvatus]|uniref:sigma-70 family RNA polymerase sigma factor n=1 Tax=Latilactobacillus curvatus TaxID=28038 RepID=UPI0020C7D70C|nr:sigma-70 family RNA polymerase sigma factor [Latilactobacillus curvatus]MCP8862010.1 sigma-70 family RNA polymerase sigma factor [Latilactobacillus curvatus]MCP8868794.1 sigma-70 family RNA polymerase sigma factor [Latilactobacillus curvatus]MCP8872295.1 sigma-70 family RNA polymerase sigma factor [Latilactobacillus curvatus]MCP8881362.1 sigma-70 family RNA polymerase sigma factor [Latilactobacillus curvatus]
MSSEQEVSRMFIRYVQQALKNERINRHKVNLRRIKETPLEEWLIEEIEDPHHLDELKLTDEEIEHLEDFIENERLATAVASLSLPDKMVLYQYYYDELNDVEIGSRSGKTGQGVNYRRQRALNRIRAAYTNM